MTGVIWESLLMPSGARPHSRRPPPNEKPLNRFASDVSPSTGTNTASALRLTRKTLATLQGSSMSCYLIPTVMERCGRACRNWAATS